MAKLVRPAYGLNDAPRRWWNKIDKSLRDYGINPTRADQCTYLLYSQKEKHVSFSEGQFLAQGIEVEEIQSKGSLVREFANMVNWNDENSERMLEYLLDPITGSPARNKNIEGVLCLQVDDLFYTGSKTC